MEQKKIVRGLAIHSVWDFRTAQGAKMSRRTLKKFFGPIILSEASEQLLTDRLHIRRAIYYYIQAKGPSEGEFQGTQGEVWGRESVAICRVASGQGQ